MQCYNNKDPVAKLAFLANRNVRSRNIFRLQVAADRNAYLATKVASNPAVKVVKVIAKDLPFVAYLKDLDATSVSLGRLSNL